MKNRIWLFGRLALVLACIGAAAGAHAAAARCERTVIADVVALEQAMVLNRYGAFNPAGMLYALRRDVVFSGHGTIPDGSPVTEATTWRMHQAR